MNLKCHFDKWTRDDLIWVEPIKIAKLEVETPPCPVTLLNIGQPSHQTRSIFKGGQLFQTEIVVQYSLFT